MSNNAKKYYRKLAKLQKEIADKRNDFLQKLTTDLARKYKHIRLETLKIKGLMKNHPPALSRTPLIKGGRGDLPMLVSINSKHCLLIRLYLMEV